MPIIKTEDGRYKGTFDVYEPSFPEVFVENRSRAVVEWKLRKEFADRLERAASDASLIRHLLDGVRWEWIEDDAVRVRGQALLSKLPDLLRELRNSEPSLLLCADRIDQQELRLDDGSEIEIDWSDWTDSREALDERAKRAWIDSEVAFAASDALEALADAGIRGPKTAATTTYLGGHLVWDFVDKAKREGRLGDDAGSLQKYADAHVRAIVWLSRTPAWSNHEAGKTDGAYFSLLSGYRERMKYELLSPSERAKVDRDDRRALAKVRRLEKQLAATAATEKRQAPKSKRGKAAA